MSVVSFGLSFFLVVIVTSGLVYEPLVGAWRFFLWSYRLGDVFKLLV